MNTQTRLLATFEKKSAVLNDGGNSVFRDIY